MISLNDAQLKTVMTVAADITAAMLAMRGHREKKSGGR